MASAFSLLMWQANTESGVLSWVIGMQLTPSLSPKSPLPLFLLNGVEIVNHTPITTTCSPTNNLNHSPTYSLIFMILCFCFQEAAYVC
ncbi:hypothetical protein ACET3Z_028506 [Daucus carota]